MYEQISKNKRNTVLLLVAFGLLIALVVWAVAYLFRAGAWAVPIAVAVAIAMAWTSYWYSDKIALSVTRARPADGPEYARLNNLVEGLCIAAGLPKPRVYVIDDPAPNAFATGRSPKHSAVAVTTGLMQIMNRVELEGVLAHELSHVKNYDILVQTIAVTAVGAVVLISDIALRMMWFTGGRSRDRSSGDGANPIGALLMVISLVFLALAPIAAKLMQFSMSRRREYLADASGVMLTRYPPGLVSALEKLRDDQAVVHHAPRATEQMWIESPLPAKEMTSRGRKQSWLDRAFATHPPLDDRIAALKEM